REAFRREIISLKERRRVSVGPVISFVFENRDTIRFQVQEMARVERMITDEAIQSELDAYNPLIPDPGELSATMFIELTDDAGMRNWLPKLVGVERTASLRIGAPGSGNGGFDVVSSIPEASHEENLTRDSVTAAVHYIRFELDAGEVERFAAGPVELRVDHPEYHYGTPLTDITRVELLRDLRP
ncbi:MAG TPA: DUF3501 family protein, partial [Acidimicrobiales bacterium]|nr:DUF3501 family protein [Acidimicrobiales bacterium]